MVLVDGDLRKPRLDKIFGIECRGGLAKLLDEAETPDEQPLSEFVHASHVENLFVLPTSAAREGITTKLHSSRLRSLIDVLRQEFDVVIIDSPPMLHLSDARVLGWLADAGYWLLPKPADLGALLFETLGADQDFARLLDYGALQAQGFSMTLAVGSSLLFCLVVLAAATKSFIATDY